MKAFVKSTALAIPLLFSTPALLLAQEAATGSTRPQLSLEQRLEELDQRQRIFERNYELAQEEAQKRPADAKAGASKKGFLLQSADGRYQLRFQSLIHADGRFYLNDEKAPGVNQFLIRRARTDLRGKLPGPVEYRLHIDFGEGKVTLVDAYADVHADSLLSIRVGKFKGPLGLERLQSASDRIFAEGGYPTQLVPNRDIGVQISGSVGNGLLAYQAAVQNGVADGGSGDGDTDDEKDVSARLFAEPFQKADIDALKKLGVGLAGSLGNQHGNPTTQFRSAGRGRVFQYRSSEDVWANNVEFDGTQRRFVPQGYYFFGPAGVLGEYAVSEHRVKRAGRGAALQHRGWVANAVFNVTGEDASAKSPNPKNPLGDGGAGAWQIIARVGELSVDKQSFPVYADPTRSFRSVLSYAGGINWFATSNYRVHTSYEISKFKAAEGSNLKRDDEHYVTARVQAAF